MAAVLRVVVGQRRGETVTVSPGEALSIGRSGESDLQLLEPGVSRFHCVVEEQAGGLVLTDLNSSNGTFVNGVRVKRQPLRKGDEFQVGSVKLAVEEAAARPGPGLARLFTDRGGAESAVVRRLSTPETVAYVPPEPRADERVERRLAALYRVADAVNAEAKLGRLMAVVVDTVLGVIRAERGFLLLADRASGALEAKVARVAPGSAADPQLPVSRPVARQCMEQAVTLLCPDLLANERYCDGDRLAMDHIRSVLCAPLEVGGRVVGALYLDSSAERAPFDEDDVELLGAIARNTGFALHRAELVEDLERLFVGAIETLVATVEAKDIYTYGHSARVSKLGRRVAVHMGLDDEAQEHVRIAGLLHDIGKIGIPESILGKPSRLTDDEWAYVRSHPQIGESIIRQMGSERVAPLCPLVRHHHERIDGKGYPDGLAGEAIPLGARILGVADAYDAMTSNRPYRPPMASEAAVAELRQGTGRQFDAQVVEAFVKVRAEGEPGEGASDARREDT